jgi:hypothetical protein
MEVQVIFLNPFTVFASCKPKFVVCLFVYEETNGSYPFANGLNGLAHPTGTVVLVLDPGGVVCADPRRGVTILWIGGPGPPKGDEEHQLSPDRGGEKT